MRIATRNAVRFIHRCLRLKIITWKILTTVYRKTELCIGQIVNVSTALFQSRYRRWGRSFCITNVHTFNFSGEGLVIKVPSIINFTFIRGCWAAKFHLRSSHSGVNTTSSMIQGSNWSWCWCWSWGWSWCWC